MSLNNQAPLSKDDDDDMCDKMKTLNYDHSTVPSSNLISSTPTSELDNSCAHLIPLNTSTPLSAHHSSSHQSVQLINCIPQSELSAAHHHHHDGHDFYPPPPPTMGNGGGGSNLHIHQSARNPHHHPQYNTLQYPKRVRVLPANSSSSIRSADDINSHLHTVV